MVTRTVNATTLKRWLDSGEAVLVDVREPAEHNAENIEGAKLVPLGNVSCGTLGNCTGKKVVIHCRSGRRGEAACEKLLAENPGLEVYNLEGGIAAWSAAGHPVQASGKPFLPLDRQVQLAIGLILLASSISGFMLSAPALFLVTGFVGAGLTVAGATGFCGLALLMARMPWNQCPIGAK